VLEFRLLGPLEVLDGDRPIRLGGPKQRAALAILLLSANRVVSVEQLADDLYAGAPPVTAVTQVQRQVSELRKVLGADAIETRSPGYVLRVEPGGLDLDRFERATHDASQALEAGDPQQAADSLGRALRLWRGAPLADLAYESFAQTAIGRLEELRLAAVEQHVDAELQLGRHVAVLGELEGLVWDHPLRERLRGQLMLALYRAGRQTEALEVYRRTRDALVGEFGIEPSPALHELERRILEQDPALELSRSAPPPPATMERIVLVAPIAGDRLDSLLSVAEPLATLPERALLVARLLADASEVASAATELAARASALAVSARTAAFTSQEPARDVVRLATNYDVELVVVASLGGGEVVGDLAAIVERSPADLAVHYGPALDPSRGDGVFVPFGGGDHDWAALELGAWLASALRAPLRLVGTTADPRRGRRDASRLLADASLATQRVVGVTAEPLLAEPTVDGLLAAVEAATVVVAGFPSRWRVEGLGAVRRAIVERSATAVLLVHGGMRPGGLAPRESRTHFSWSLGSTA
jgi:DNA-binding SARP family transcriptional activator